jgi:hypothetical protein
VVKEHFLIGKLRLVTNDGRQSVTERQGTLARTPAGKRETLHFTVINDGHDDDDKKKGQNKVDPIHFRLCNDPSSLFFRNRIVSTSRFQRINFFGLDGPSLSGRRGLMAVDLLTDFD